MKDLVKASTNILSKIPPRQAAYVAAGMVVLGLGIWGVKKIMKSETPEATPKDTK